MYRGRYSAAIEELRQSILLHKTYGFALSEFRDRMFLARALEAKGRTAESSAELDAAHAIMLKQTLGAEWLTSLGRVDARTGRLRDARQILAQAEKVAGNTLTDSSVNRNVQRDQMLVMELKGEVARAERRFDEAISFLQPLASERAEQAMYSLAATLQAAGRFEDAAREYRRLLDDDPLGREPQEDWLAAHVRLGEVFEKLNRPDDARQWYEKLLTLWKDGDQDLKLRAEAAAGLARLGKR
jgi:tetratricopeptide (TPR) repeat protein